MEHSLEIQLTVHGIKLEDAYDSQLFAAKKCEVISSGKSVPDCVHIDYKVSVKADPSVCEQRYINSIVPREVDLFLQSLSLLLRRPSHLIGCKAKLDGVAAEPTVQQYAPTLYSLAEMFNRGKFTPSGLSILPPRDFWDLLGNTISSYRQRPDDVSRRLTLALRWFKKGSDELNSSDRLVAFWISFNALYVDPQIPSEQRSIKSYICNNMGSEMAKRYVNDYRKDLEILSQLPTEKIPIELKCGRQKQQITECLATILKANTQNYIEIVNATALAIYAIRNNLFHGRYDPVSEDAQKHVATAEDLLSSLVRELMFKEMTGNPLTVATVSSVHFEF